MSLIFCYGMVYFMYKKLGSLGVYIWVVIASIVANIEVGITIKAFGMFQTLGNIVFASTFLATDILSENEGKKSSNMAVTVGIITNLIFICLSRFWFLFHTEGEYIESVKKVFVNTPRFMVVGIIVFVIAQYLDVFLYHFIWEKTKKYSKNDFSTLWIRNNLSTLISQLINCFLFSVLAFYGVLNYKEIFNIFYASYLIFIFTSILDTPIVYLCKKLKK
ncbi:MAG: queuosine precursor transporter [Cetobacterium sp.]